MGQNGGDFSRIGEDYLPCGVPLHDDAYLLESSHVKGWIFLPLPLGKV